MFDWWPLDEYFVMLSSVMSRPVNLIFYNLQPRAVTAIISANVFDRHSVQLPQHTEASQSSYIGNHVISAYSCIPDVQ